MTLTFGEKTFTLGKIRFTLEGIHEDSRVLGIYFLGSWGGFGTLWVGGSLYGFFLFSKRGKSFGFF